MTDPGGVVADLGILFSVTVRVVADLGIVPCAVADLGIFSPCGGRFGHFSQCGGKFGHFGKIDPSNVGLEAKIKKNYASSPCLLSG